MGKFPEEMLTVAKNEKNISAADLLVEIKAYIDEYFVCDTKDDNGTIILNFFNGQNFVIGMQEFKRCAPNVSADKRLVCC